MNVLILLNSVNDENKVFLDFEKNFNDGNDYYIYSLEKRTLDFKNNNFMSFKKELCSEIDDLMIISDSNYLKIEEEYYNNFSFLFKKFFDKISSRFYGFIVYGNGEILKLEEPSCVEKQLKIIKEINNKECEILKYNLLKYVDLSKGIFKIELNSKLENYLSILCKYNYFIFTSNKNLKYRIISEEKLPNFVFYIKDISELQNSHYQQMFRNKILIYLNNDDEIVIYNKVDKIKNTIYQIGKIRDFQVNQISVDNMFDQSCSNFVFYIDSIDFSKVHTNSLYTDLRKEEMGCKIQTQIFSLKENE